MKGPLLTKTEELDFHYLLSLMVPLHGVPEFAWLPELFSIIGYEKLLVLCKYAGGECIKIPTIDQLSQDIEVLQWYYDVVIKQTKSISEVPPALHESLDKVLQIYARPDQASDS